MRQFLSLILCLAILQTGSAQWCATDGAAIEPYLDANLKNMLPQQRGAVKYIPITFHLVADANGIGRVTEEGVLQVVANLNTQYADQDAIFYIDHFNYFNSDVVYDTPLEPAAESIMQGKRDNNSANVFITNQIGTTGSGGTALGVYITNRDWVIVTKGNVNLTNYTLNHEMGHFFSLEHTFYGFDCYPYSIEDYGNPVNRTTTKPCEGGGGSLLIELHNRSNCTTAGDKICDTPEDYNLGYSFQPGCDTNTLVRDKNNQLINPMVNNVMSYYLECTSYVFTQTQKNLINTDFFSGHRNYIRTGVIPNTTPVNTPVNYITPINGQETSTQTGIVLDWDDVPGATQYLIIYARNASFTINPVKAIVTTSNYTINETLNNGSKYYWKVWPYNESQTGAMYSATQNFIVGEGTGVNEIAEIDDYVIHPNPAFTNQSVLLSLSTIKSFKAELSVVDLSGHVLVKQMVQLSSGQTDLPVPVENLSAGIYVIMLHSDSGRLIERLVVQ